MTPLKDKGDLAELIVAADLRARGYRIAIPFGEACPYDLVLDRGTGPLERVQVKHSTSDGRVIHVRCRTQSITSGRVRATKQYTAQDVDWIAVYDPTSGGIFYLPASELADGRSILHLRLDAPRNGQRAGIRDASDYLSI